MDKFGFYFVNDVTAVTQNGWADYLDEVAALKCCNVAIADVRFLFAGDYPAAVAGLSSFLTRAAAAGMDVILGLDFWTLVADAAWQAGVGRLAAAISGHNNLRSFYFDEPQPSVATTFAARTAGLRARFPDIGVMATVMVPDLGVHAPATFASCTDLATNYYLDYWYWSADWAVFRGYFAQLEALAAAGQRLWLVPQAFIQPNIAQADYPAYVRRLYDALNFYFEFGQGRAMMEGMMLFLYSPGLAGQFGPTLRQLLADYPYLAALVMRMGKSITER